MMKNEKGRSMVEMLGVLAIIGVLSVAGIAGYTVAMRKYRANEIAQAISMLAVAAKTGNQGAGISEDTSYVSLLETSTVPAGVNMLKAKAEDGKFSGKIELTVDSTELCSAVENIFGDSQERALYVSQKGCSEAPFTLELTVK